MSESDIEDLDISWLEEHEKEIQIDKNYKKEKIEKIQTKYIYINSNNEIEKIEENFTNVDYQGIISKNKLIDIVQKRRNIFSEKKYSLFDILTYIIDLDSKSVQIYSKTQNIDDENSKQFLKKHTIFNDIILPDSISIFNKINTLYFIFKEKIPVNNQKEKDKQYIKSILKNKTNKTGEDLINNKKKNITKKVYFKE